MNNLIRIIRINEYDIPPETEDLVDILQKHNVNISWQFKGELDEKGCRIMEQLPLGNWTRSFDAETNEIIFWEQE